jgi:type II secretory pathway component PulF
MNDVDVLLIGLCLAGAILAGVVLLWFASASYAASDRFPMKATLLRTAGGFLLVGGLLTGIVITTQFIAIIAVPIVVIVLIVTVRRFYAAEWQSLLWVLLSAAERGIPLDAAARAFAAERNDVLSVRAAKLADYLEAGVPLGLALRRSGHHIEPEVSLAADLGYQTGTLGPALRQVIDRLDQVDAATVPVAVRLIYLGLIVVHVLIVQAFLLLKIVPVMFMMHHSFDAPVPSATTVLNATADLGTGESYLWLFLSFSGLVALSVGVLWLLGFPLRSLPFIRRFWWRVDCSWVMRWLATGVRQGRPIVETMRLLAGYFPQSTVRRRLERSAQRVEQGGHWCDGLLRSELIRRSDSAVFKAAERTGNLPWALDEMADSSLRRWRYRIQVWMNILFPLAVIVLGASILVVLLGVFTPLLSLIRGSL